MTTSFFRPLQQEQAFLKAGLYGFAGSGKTWTASLMAIGLARHIQATTVAFFETETGADYVQRQLFAPAQIALVGMKSRAFADALTAIATCEKERVPILILDSISHIWRELTDAYMKKKGRTRIEFQDWAVLKSEWAKLTDAFLASKVHIFLCGRAGYEYDYFEDSDGKKQLEKTGIKMKAETEMGYEPSLILRMERDKVFENDTQRIVRQAHVEKDRFGVIDGKVFANPTFSDILPHVALLNLGGAHVVADQTRTSEALLQDPDRSAEERRRRRTIALDEIKATFDKYLPNAQSAAVKSARVEIAEQVFGVKSWAAVEALPLELLEDMLKRAEDGTVGMLETACAAKAKTLTPA